jgi:hypothetical protein
MEQLGVEPKTFSSHEITYQQSNANETPYQLDHSPILLVQIEILDLSHIGMGGSSGLNPSILDIFRKFTIFCQIENAMSGNEHSAS